MIFRLAIILSALLGYSNEVLAEPVMLRGAEIGQGYMFSHRGNCYVVFPAHVTSPRARLQVIAEGAVTGSATPRFPFWAGLDLAVASVRRDAAKRCTAKIADLRPAGTPPPPSGLGVLVLVDREGHLSRHRMQITDVSYLTFEASFTSKAVDVIQGMSGGFFFINNRPVGMALEKTDTGGIRFMRIEEIHMNLSRWLGTQSGVVFAPQSEADTPGAAQTDTTALSVLTSTVPASGPGTMVENLLIDSGAFVFEPAGQPQIDFLVGERGTKTTVGRVRMRSDPDAGDALPRRIVILINASEEGGRWRSFWSGEMPRTGELDTGPIAPSWAKRLRVIIASAWGLGPVRIDRIWVE